MNKNMDKNPTASGPNELGTQNYDELLIEENEELFGHPRTNLIETIFNIIKLFLGISILASPAAYSQSGLIGGIIGVALAACINVCTVIMQSEA